MKQPSAGTPVEKEMKVPCLKCGRLLDVRSLDGRVVVTCRRCKAAHVLTRTLVTNSY